MNRLERIESEDGDLGAALRVLGAEAKAAARQLALAPADQKNIALQSAAAAMRATTPAILGANALDLEAARSKGQTTAFLDRLKLDAARVEAIAKALEEVAELADPVGSVLASWERPNGLKIERVRVPLGVVGIIFESRPNVTADAGALALKAGNAAILRSGSESFHSSRAIHAALVDGLKTAGLPHACISLIQTTSREAVGEMLQGLGGTIDVIVPRGGKGLVARIQAEARVPVLAHLEGICHTYVDRDADLEMAVPLVVNAKLRRTGICGATECLLVDAGAPPQYLAALLKALLHAGCEVRGDQASQRVDARVKAAQPDDYGKEFLDAVIAVKLVDGVDGAIDHVTRFGSQHTDCIVTKSSAAAERFLRNVDSAIVLHNASTQFADGGEFGMGAEIGIATGKLHARGPVGVEQLTTFKYVVRGSGQIRPG